MLLIQATTSPSPFHESSLVVSAERVAQQVFFTRVPDLVSQRRPCLWVLRYLSSSYLALPNVLGVGDEDDYYFEEDVTQADL